VRSGVGRSGLTPESDRECQSLQRYWFRLSQSKDAEGRQHEQGSTLCHSYASEAIADKIRVISKASSGRESRPVFGKPTEDDDATQDRKYCVGRTSDEIGR